MNLQEIFDQLSYGELSQVSVGGGEMGEITEANWPRVLGHVNLGLLDLYKRFNLKEGKLVLALQPGRTSYPLKSEYAVNAKRSKQPVRYIVDTQEAPFADDIIKVEKVLTEAKHQMSLNDGADAYSVFTPSALVLNIPTELVTDGLDLPDPLKTETLEVSYRAKHPPIVQGIGYFDPSRVELELPDTHLRALLLFVAARVNTPIGMIGEMQGANNLLQQYELEIKSLESGGLQVDIGSQSTKFAGRGFV